MPKKNDVVEITIDSLEFPNKGIGKFEDYKAIVKNTLPGETVSARICKKKNGVIEGRLLEVVKKPITKSKANVLILTYAAAVLTRIFLLKKRTKLKNSRCLLSLKKPE